MTPIMKKCTFEVVGFTYRHIRLHLSIRWGPLVRFDIPDTFRWDLVSGSFLIIVSLCRCYILECSHCPFKERDVKVNKFLNGPPLVFGVPESNYGVLMWMIWGQLTYHSCPLAFRVSHINLMSYSLQNLKLLNSRFTLMYGWVVRPFCTLIGLGELNGIYNGYMG